MQMNESAGERSRIFGADHRMKPELPKYFHIS